MIHIDIAHVLTLFARYGETTRDLIVRLRPGRFAAIIRNGSHKYIKPIQFLVITVAISGVAAFTAAALIVAGAERETLFHIGILGAIIIVAAAWLENLVIVVVAKLCAFALGISANFSDLLDGYCYSSVLFLPVVIVAELVLLGSPEPRIPMLVTLAIVQVTFLAYACFVMANFVIVHPRYRWRLAVGTFVAVVTLSFGVVAVIQHGEPNDYEANVLWNIAPNDLPTLVAWNVSRNPSCTTCWSDSVTARAGETIEVKIFYHQSASRVAAVQPRFKLLLPTEVAADSPIGAVISASNSPKPVSGVVTIHNDGSRAFKLVSKSAVWWPAQPDVGARELPYRQTAAALLSPKGMLLEDVPAGCDYRGDVVIQLTCE